jgi:ubiquinone/menaquinone biosynthesis C-methylase UbiE
MKMPDETAVKFHDRLAAGWERHYAGRFFAAREALLRGCLEDTRIHSTEWLDAGCGTGTLARSLSNMGAIVQGVDASAEMIRMALALKNGDPRVSFRQLETIAQLPYERDAFDGILCSSVLEYVDDPQICLKEFARVLKDSGRLLVSIPPSGSLIRFGLRAAYRLTASFGTPWPEYLKFSKHEYSPKEFSRMLGNAGFLPIRVLPFGPIYSKAFKISILPSLLMFVAAKKRV